MTLFIKNPTDENKSFMVVGSETSNFDNKGPEGAVVVTNDDTQMAVCLAPMVNVNIDPVKTATIDLEGSFVVQVGNEIIPYSFTAEQLPNFFNGLRPEALNVIFEKDEANDIDEMYFTTTAGLLVYQGYGGDTLMLNDGSTVVMDASGGKTFTVPAGKHKVKLVAERNGYVAIAGETLTEIHNFPIMSSINVVRFSHSSVTSPNLIKVPVTLPPNITNISNMFYGASNFNQDISNWDTSNVTDMRYTFWEATNFSRNLSSWCVPLITTAPDGFASYANMEWGIDYPVWGTCPNGEEVPSVAASEMFFTTTAGTIAYQGSSGDVFEFSDGSTVPIVSDEMYYSITVPAGKHKLKLTNAHGENIAIDGYALTEVHNFPTLSAINHIQFTNGNGSPSLVKVPDTLPSNITNLQYMFSSAANFNQDISMWDVSHVTNMAFMFQDATKFNQPLSAWNAANVTDMRNMFYNSPFNQDISTWDTSKVFNMSFMFAYNTSFNQPIGSWNTNKVSEMGYMFNNSSSFNQDLSGWCVPLIYITPEGFKDSSPLSPSNLPVWGTCPRGENLF